MLFGTSELFQIYVVQRRRPLITPSEVQFVSDPAGQVPSFNAPFFIKIAS
jgi:hypothetical protein